MDYRKIVASALALSLAAISTGCGNGSSSAQESAAEITAAAETTEAATEAETVEATEPTTEELIPPTPAEATDPNTVTFDDGDFSFASAKTVDKDSAQGELEVVEVEGNKMLRFTDDGTNFANDTVQKIQIDAAMLLTPENVAKVRRIEFDVYADATADSFVADSGESLKVPGWIGGGGGANCAGDNWYDFGEWSGGEYNFEMSGAVHGEFKFLLAAGGKCWDETMPEATFLIMRWGPKNEGNFYLDNIVFYDEDGNSLPLAKAEPAGEEAPAQEEAPAAEPEEAAPEAAE
ncbi:MAG: hypothetical protein IJM44_00185 [Ruminococcus sp.]|nr:hypothetical protein [Ruminococcus sp.]